MSAIPDTHKFNSFKDRGSETLTEFQQELAAIVKPLLPKMSEVAYHFKSTLDTSGVIDGVRIGTNHHKCNGSRYETLSIILSDPNNDNKKRIDEGTFIMFDSTGDEINFLSITGVKRDILDLMVKAKSAFEDSARVKASLAETGTRSGCMCSL